MAVGSLTPRAGFDMDGSPTIYAHTLRGQPPAHWETLATHAAAVASLARVYATAFGAGEWGDLLGRWHDLGKRSDVGPAPKLESTGDQGDSRGVLPRLWRNENAHSKQ
jgi:hypothetical protein